MQESPRFVFLSCLFFLHFLGTPEAQVAVSTVRQVTHLVAARLSEPFFLLNMSKQKLFQQVTICA